jgi:hypothetical protein
VNDLSQPRRFQFRFSTAIVVMIVAALAIGIVIRVTEPPIPESLRRMERADPVIDLKAAIATGDHRFIGIFGIGLSTPGAPRELAKKYGVNPIKGTSDCIIGHEMGRLQSLAIKYAETYNKMLLEHLQKADSLQK